jgi:hypothetical protein
MGNIYQTLEIGQLFVKSGFPYLIAGLTQDGNINRLLMSNLCINIYRGDLLIHRRINCHSPHHHAGTIAPAAPATDTCVLTIPITPGLEIGLYVELYPDDSSSWREITAINEVDGLVEITAKVIAKPIYHYDQTTGLTERIQ